jgi:hypothetical protein
MRLTKHVAVGALAALGLVSLNAPVRIEAQSMALKANIPFEFHVGDKKLPAGTYIIERQGDALRIAGAPGQHATVLSNAVSKRQADVRDMLIFSRYGDNYFLSEARWSGYNTARGVLKSRSEAEFANLFTPERLYVAGLAR